VEAPGQQDAGSEDGIKVEVDYRGRNGTKRTLEHNAGGDQEQRARQDQGLKRFWAPEIHLQANPFGELLIGVARSIISDA
jgi:hypothetical protein